MGYSTACLVTAEKNTIERKIDGTEAKRINSRSKTLEYMNGTMCTNNASAIDGSLGNSSILGEQVECTDIDAERFVNFGGKKGGKSILLSSLLLMQWEEKAPVCFGGKESWRLEKRWCGKWGRSR